MEVAKEIILTASLFLLAVGGLVQTIQINNIKKRLDK